MPPLEDRDRIEHLGIPCTSVARTLLDLAAHGLPRELSTAIDQALEIDLFDLRAIEDVISRNEGRRGVKRLRSALVPLTMDRERFVSVFERRFLPIVRSAGLPTPIRNHVLRYPGGQAEADFWFPDLRLVVETDGYRFHRRRDRFGADRRRDRRLAAIGILTLRFVWEDLDDPDGIRRDLVAAARFRT